MLPARPFYLIRHGETVMNARRLTCGGGVDTELNEAGLAQTETAARVLAALDEPLRPTLIIHSGMKRTVETTRILNEVLNLPTLADPELREHMMGEWEQQPWDAVMPFLHGDTNVKPKGGESRDEFMTRVKTAMNKQLAQHASERVLFVAHGGTFHSLALMHGVRRDVFIPNATLHRFDPEPAHDPMPWRVTLYDWRETLISGPAPYCPSQPDPEDTPHWKIRG